MNTLILQKRAERLERLAKKIEVALFELKIAQSKLEITKKVGKTYSSATRLMKDISKKAK